MKASILFAALSLTLALFSFSYAIHETTPAETQVVLPGPDAAKLYEYLTIASPYTRWQMWPGKGAMYKGTQPHGDFLTTYLNNTAMLGIKENKGAFPEGSIIVKENYGPDRKSTGLSVMYKIKGYNAAAGDWFWAKYDKDGKALAAGRAEACIKCHEKKKDNDFIFTGELKK